MSTEVQLDVLAIFSHPDDAELTMAGTLLKLKSLGHRVGVADMTRGEMGTRGTPEIVFTSHWDDPHPDHAATARIVREAARLATMRRYDEQAGLDAIKMPAIAHV